MIDMKKIGVFVLNYNGKKFINQLYPSLINQTYTNYDIVVIDNKSNDGSNKEIKSKFPDINIIELKKNYGFARSLNYAAKKFCYKYLVFLNNDVYLDKNWLKSLFDVIIKDEKIIMVNSKVLFWDYPNYINSAGAKISLFGNNIHIGIYEQNDGKFDKERSIGSAQGVSMLVNRELFLKMGGFDENYFIGGEETDFCWRAWQNGFCIKYSPNSIVYHKVGFSIDKSPKLFKEYEVNKNRYLTIIKNPGTKYFPLFLSSTFFYDFYSLLTDFSVIKFHSRLKILLFLIQNIKLILNIRIIQQKIRILSDNKLFRFGLFASFKDYRDIIKKNQLFKKRLSD